MTTSQFIYQNLGEMVDQESINGLPMRQYIEEIKTLYLKNNTPWVIGYSGGKDSTVTVELVYWALLELKKEQRHKPIFVICSDTLVETPVIVDLISKTLKLINEQAKADGIPLTTHIVTPRVDKTFWVNLLGKGYPAPSPMFRWCTENMKINPVSVFIKDKVSQYGEAIVLLGARKEESSSRAQVIARHRIEGSRLNKHSNLPNAYVYTPIEDWTADDVWLFLMGSPTPWKTSNQQLFDLYKDSNQGECPLVIDTSTPSCGNSRFGCWTCTVVTKDKAMQSLIKSGETWMQDLADFRDKMTLSNHEEKRHELRNYRRRTGKVTYYSANRIDDDGEHKAQVVRGPLYLKVRQEWLKELLTIEKGLRDTENETELITQAELHQIRQEWFNDPNEPDWSDSLPRIYREVYGAELNWVENDAGAFSQTDAELLEELAAKYQTSSPLIMKLLDLELSLDGLSKRSGIFKKIGGILKQDWDELDSILEKHSQMTNTDNYKTLVKKQFSFEGKLVEGKHKNIFEEASDRLTREHEYYGNILKQLEETN